MTSYGSIPPEDVRVPESNGGNASNGEDSPLLKGNGQSPPHHDSSERSLWSKLTFHWFSPLLYRGNEKQKLDHDDLELVPLPQCYSTEDVAGVFEKYWREELQREHPSLVRALLRAFGGDFLRGAALKFVHDLCLFVGPQVLHDMIDFLRDDNATIWKGLGLTLAVTLSQLAMSVCLRHYFFKCYTTGLRARTAIVISVYRKALVLSASERQTRSMGEITNLMSIDAQRLQDLTTYLNAIWSSPLQIILSLFFLWQQLGPSSLGGVTVIVIMIPVTKVVAQWMGSMQKKLMRAKDNRIELNAEVLGGMKIIKFQAWEESFQKRILDLREAELAQLLRYFVAQAFSRMLWTFTPLFVALATFAAYVWSDHELDVASALTALALFGILRFPLFMLPQTINSLVEAIVTLKRLRSFFLCDEYSPVGSEDLDEKGIRIVDLSAAYDSKRPAAEVDADSKTKELIDKDWELSLVKAQLAEAERRIKQLTGQEKKEESTMSSSLLCLSRINFECRPGELVAVVGQVGCGKTSFVNSILGEVRLLTGKAAVRGELAYFSQTPFVMNASIRDNILFGHVNEPVDEDLYQRALSCCALQHDLKLLPDGDLTEVGERGITLSGGQKARVALARAVYHSADITLIDDALSAVDAHVAKHLFDEAILGEFLKPCVDGAQRSVVLVTNALQYLNHPRVDKILVVQDGHVVEEGTYDALSSKSDSVFSRFLAAIKETDVSENLVEDDPTPARRKSSNKQVAKSQDDPLIHEPKAEKLVKEEARQTGQVGLDVYLTWVRAAGGVIAPITILLLFAAVEGVSVLSNWWLTYWSGNADSESQTTFLGVYALINVSAALAGFFRVLFISFVSLKASRALFDDLLSAILHAPMSFFDTTPVGRLVNRFSKDIYSIDEKLTGTLRTYLQTLFSVFSTIVVIVGVTPQFLLCLIPMIVFYIREQLFFTLTYRELKRLDSVTRSPIYALLGETIDGVAVIRAYSAQETLVKRLVSMLDAQQHAYYLTCTAQSWLALRLELVGTLIVTFASLIAVIEHAASGADEKFAGLAGLAISYALSVTQSLNWSVRMASDMEANMVAVERVQEYSRIESEGARETDVDKDLTSVWPEKGEIIFKQAKLRYRPGLPLVLKGLDLKIPAGSKVGVVGRTGAGKSTLMVALMRIVELSEGSIFIDDRDTSSIGLAKLRQNLAVVAQDPVLFSGTVRTNLDPFQDFSDAQLCNVLASVGLYKESSIGDPGHRSALLGGRIDSLDDVVSENGSNFSVGQRQLIVIARALLRGSKILITDEATASIDAEMDAAIQSVLRTEFSNATVLTVAHRLNTIMDSDYILVMADGRVAEFDKPDALLKKGGMFRDLVKAASHE